MDRQPSDPGSDVITLVVSATFTAETIEPVLSFWMRELGMPTHIRFSPYGQVMQQLLDPSSLISRNRGGINFLLVRFEDWVTKDGEIPLADERQRAAEAKARDFARAVSRCSANSPAVFLIVFCPPSTEGASRPDTCSVLAKMETIARSELQATTGVSLIGFEEISRTYPVSDYYDRSADEIGHIPYTPAFFAALGTTICRKIRALKSRPFKVIAVDCDQTLWSGVCGEDGPEGVRIDPARRFLQQFLLEQKRSGMLLCLCSKNSEEDVTAVFQKNAGMMLKRDDFAAARINWEPKSENLRSLAAELRLSLDGFLILDDDPLECAEVQANCPEVLALPLPGNRDDLPRFLEHAWVFDRATDTVESGRRHLYYAQERERDRLRADASTLEAFIASLGLKVRISPPTPEEFSRVSELTYRTNQFNLTSLRRSEADIQEFLREDDAYCRVVHVKDRFGDYGLVGVLLFRNSADVVTVDTFLLSCRALGRGVEHRMLASLGELGAKTGAGWVVLRCVPSSKNRPAQQFLDQVGAEFKIPSDASSYRLPVDFAAGVRYRPVTNPEPISGSDEAPNRGSRTPSIGEDNRSTSAVFCMIANELYDAKRVQRIVAEESGGARSSDIPFVEPKSDIEEKVALIFAELLGVKKVSATDHFFSLGGHSLLVTQMLARLRDTFDVDLSPRLMFTIDLTVQTLSQAVVRAVIKKQLGNASPQEIASILEELERLSDADVRELLDASGRRISPRSLSSG